VKKLLLALVLAILGSVLGARAQDVVDPNNTVVRFVISTGGTNLGSMDIELFDSEKPETVANFLLYVYSGAYSNLVINRLVTDFVMQAGKIRLTNAPTTNQFLSYETPPRNFGPITNEYSVGPERKNEFGTIAMARLGSITNSASAEWFFNLTNNPHLDTNYGGYTVFGHIIDTAGPNNGTNVLNYFNEVPAENIFDFGGDFAALPLSTVRFGIIEEVDLYTVDVFILRNGRPRETNAPSFALNEPTGNFRTTNGTARFSGTASDDTGVFRIVFENEEIGYSHPGSTDWSVDLPLTPGTNHITVRSIDRFGNESSRVRRTIFYSVKRPINVMVRGDGRVRGVRNGQLLELGVNYSIHASPSRRHYFLNWEGAFNSPNRRVKFRMQEDMTIIARFSRTLNGLVDGSYEGLFFTATNGPRTSAGRISLDLSRNGRYSGRLRPIGDNFQIRGRFGSNGRTTIFGFDGLDPIVLSMQLLSPGFPALLGTYTVDSPGFSGHSVSDVVLFRTQRFSGTNVAPARGRYTFVITPPTNHVVAAGYGSGTLVVGSRGLITMSGALGDGRAIGHRSQMLRDNRWLFYDLEYDNKGGLLGFGVFTTNRTVDALGRWFNPDFPGSTNLFCRLWASAYTPPAGGRVLNWTNGVMTLSDGRLGAPISIDTVLAEDGSFSFPADTHNVQLSVSEANGLATGSFTHPVTQELTPLRGAVLQSSNIVAGRFQSDGRDGAFVIRAVTP
jgi:cyclophilin family peptidyl-prolyl cis-trans isomerase